MARTASASLSKKVGTRYRPDKGARVYAFGLQGMKRRNNGVDFFVSQMAAFARVGIEAGNEDDRFGYAELMAQVVFKNADNRLN